MTWEQFRNREQYVYRAQNAGIELNAFYYPDMFVQMFLDGETSLHDLKSILGHTKAELNGNGSYKTNLLRDFDLEEFKKHHMRDKLSQGFNNLRQDITALDAAGWAYHTQLGVMHDEIYEKLSKGYLLHRAAFKYSGTLTDGDINRDGYIGMTEFSGVDSLVKIEGEYRAKPEAIARLDHIAKYFYSSLPNQGQ